MTQVMPPATQVRKVRNVTRDQRLVIRANIALAAAAFLAAFLAASLAGAGWTWQPLHGWFTAAVAVAAVTSLACYLLAGLTRGDSPQVTHPPTTAVLTPSEVRK